MRNKNRFTTSIKHEGYGKNQENPLSVIIPVAGMAHRMKSYGPKCLLRVNRRHSILDKIILNIQSIFPFSEIIVVVGFESDKVIKTLSRKIRIVENYNYKTASIVESLRLGINNSVNDNLLIVYGDLIFNAGCLNDITKHGSSMIIDTKGKFDDEEIGVTVVDKMVTRFAYGLETKWSHIAYLEGEEFEMFNELCQNKANNKMYPFELFNTVLTDGGSFRSVEPKGINIKEIDSLKDMEK